MLGFIFAPSKRQVAAAQVALIARAVRAAHPNNAPLLVGVFVNETPETLRAAAAEASLDALQLSGDEEPAILDDLDGLTVIKALRLGTGEVEPWLLVGSRVRLMVDANVPGVYGGAGVTADWDAAAALARRTNLLLAGGLTPENVAAAVAQVRPWGVDVSSGVETNGIKNSARIRAFIAAARAAR